MSAAENVKKILFVCTGNSCRSIMAEAYFKKRAAEEKIDVEARSAGTIAIDGRKPAENTAEVLTEEGIDPTGYSSNQLKEDVVRWADLIIVMEPLNEERVTALVPDAEVKVRYLGRFGGEGAGMNTPDPIGLPLEVYREAFSIIKRSIEGLIEWLKE